MTAHTVLGESVPMPVQIRSARACSALFAVRAGPARRTLGEVGLEPVTPLPNRALAALVFVQYIDGDLGPYHEFGVAFLCRLPGRRSTTGAYIHWLPVNQSFTCEAGRSIWGFPKEIADIELGMSGPAKYCAVTHHGRPAVTLRVARGVPVPSGAGALSIDAYTCRDGVLRRTPWRMQPAAVRMRPGGAHVELGEHPIADELRDLGLPRTAVSTSHIGTLRMSFEDAEEIR